MMGMIYFLWYLNFRFQPNGVGLLALKRPLIYIYIDYFCPDPDDSTASESESSEESDDFSDEQESKVCEVCQQNPHLLCVTPHLLQTSDLHPLAFLF